MDGNAVTQGMRLRTYTCAGTLLLASIAASGKSQAVAANAQPERATMKTLIAIDVTKAPLRRVLSDIARQAGLHPVLVKDAALLARPVTMHVKGMPVGDAFATALAGTGLAAVISGEHVVFVDQAGETEAQGEIAGVVHDAKTQRPIEGVSVSVDNATKAVVSGRDGRFRIPNVADGEHVIHFRKVGYVKTTRTVTVTDGQATSLDVGLELSVNALEQVVVTGTVVPTELKAVPNAITIVTGKELEQRGVTRIYELFRGDVPGLFTSRTGQAGAVNPGQVGVLSRGSTQLTGGGNAGVDPNNEGIKTYVDGVELANKSYLGMIDPSSIDRIEIITGPQASTIYGSNAISGVMQIFTKRGVTQRPQLTASFQNAWTQNNFSSALAPMHQADASVTGVEGHLSYNSGGSWQRVGSWSPSVQTQTISGYGGGRVSTGPLTTDLSLRANQVRNRSGGTDNQAYVERTVDGETGNQIGLYGVGIPNRLVQAATDVAGGVTATYVLTRWWSHTMTLGVDHLGGMYQRVNLTYVDPTDTTYYMNQNTMQRLTGAYNTTLQAPVTSMGRLVVTLGADVSHETEEVLNGAYITSGNGFYAPSAIYGGIDVSRTKAPGHGGFLTSQFGLWDALFLTYGLRAEYNPNVGKDQNPNLQPSYGAALAQTIGAVTVKLRGKYGHSTRQPNPGISQAVRLSALGAGSVQVFGDTVFIFANPNLLPEQQQGGEGGLELYVGNRASLVVTGYNQTVDDLIQLAVADSVDRLPAWKSAHSASVCAQAWKCPFRQREYLNLGSVRDQGWELTGTLNLGPFATRGTYSWTKSRLIGITPRYRRQFPQYIVGSTFAEYPEHTYGAEVAYVHGGTRIAYDLQGQGSVVMLNSALLGLLRDYRLQMNTPRADINSIINSYKEMYSGYALGDLNISHQFLPQLEGLVQIHNVTNSYQSEVDPGIAQAGRATNLGVRLRF